MTSAAAAGPYFLFRIIFRLSNTCASVGSYSSRASWRFQERQRVQFSIICIEPWEARKMELPATMWTSVTPQADGLKVGRCCGDWSSARKTASHCKLGCASELHLRFACTSHSPPRAQVSILVWDSRIFLASEYSPLIALSNRSAITTRSRDRRLLCANFPV